MIRILSCIKALYQRKHRHAYPGRNKNYS